MSKKFELPPEEIAELKEAFNLFDKVLTLIVSQFCAKSCNNFLTLVLFLTMLVSKL